MALQNREQKLVGPVAGLANADLALETRERPVRQPYNRRNLRRSKLKEPAEPKIPVPGPRPLPEEDRVVGIDLE
jgi:hypothetical protein